MESDGLRRLLKLKTRELANIRRLAQEVVRQRTDSETFLIDSLAFVREQVRSMRSFTPIGVLPGPRDGEVLSACGRGRAEEAAWLRERARE